MSKKVNGLPTEAYLPVKEDKCWNIAPLGYSLNNKGKKKILGWYLNDQNRDEQGRYIETIPSTSILITGKTGSGKTVLEQAIIDHINRFPDNFQLVGADLKLIDFHPIEDKFTAVLYDAISCANFAQTLQGIMMSRFKLMEEYQVNNIYKVGNQQVEVNYYKTPTGTYQFDTLVKIFVDLDESDSRYARYKKVYKDGKMPVVTTIEEVYKALEKGSYEAVELDGKTVTKKDIKKTKGIYVSKAIVFMVDEMTEAMCNDDYKSVDTIKTAIGSIARLGRAAGVHLVLCCQRPSGAVISTDLKNNIQMSVLLGRFDEEISMLTFEKDISGHCTGVIGRGFVSSGNEIFETQVFGGVKKGFFD